MITFIVRLVVAILFGALCHALLASMVPGDYVMPLEDRVALATLLLAPLSILAFVPALLSADGARFGK